MADEGTQPEEHFVKLFSEVCGIDKVSMLVPQFPVTDIYGNSRFIDFAIRTTFFRVAFEIDGLTWHHPAAITIEKFEDDLLRQNSLIHDRWKVFRWSDRQILDDEETVREQLTTFLASVPGLLGFSDFLPRQLGSVIEFREHQQEALNSLEALRRDGVSIALLAHATGTGKTVVAIADAKRLGGRTLFVVHTTPLVKQATEAFREFWPEVTTGQFGGGVRDLQCHNVVATVQSLVRSLEEFDPDQFDYLVIDEAHHSTADTWRGLLAYFRAKFTLGLTATPERADGEDLLEIFKNSAHRLSLQEAVERGELVPIRCFRVETNVDLTRVRFNAVDYRRSDVEQLVTIPGRDRLIVDTYLSHVPNRRAVVFCVNVRHSDSIAELFRAQGVAAASVSGRMTPTERETILTAFEAGELKVLCACDVLTEGWDCPAVEVLLMARPTLSKVVYLQQIGRGTRRSPGKECLVVIDFVDNTNRYSVSLSLHRVLGKPKYRPGGFVVAPQDAIDADERTIQNGEKPTQAIDISLWVKEFVEVDLFNWQEALRDMISLPDLERELTVAENRLRTAVDKGRLLPDQAVQVGERTYPYFVNTEERKAEICQLLGIERIEPQTVRRRFLDFCRDMDMSSSYKPVFLLAMLDSVDETGTASIQKVLKSFRDFYENRAMQRLDAERGNNRLRRITELDDSTVRRTMLESPYEKFERRSFMKYARDLAFLRFDGHLWRQLTENDKSQLRMFCDDAIKAYFDRE